MPARHLLLALMLSIIFGTGWILGKAALDHFPPILTAAFRFGIAAAAMLPVSRWPDIRPPVLLLLSVLAISVPYSLSYIGLGRLDVSTTVLIVQLEAPLLIAMSALFLREFPRRIVVIGVAVSVLGVLLVAGRPAVNGALPAVAIVLVSMIVWAAGQLLIRRFGIDGSVGLLGALALLAAPQLVILSAVFEQGQLTAIMTASATSWLQLAYLGLVMTGMGVGIWYYLIARHPIHRVAPFLLLVPAISVVGGVALLGESVSPDTIAGGLLIAAGVGMATLIPATSPGRPGQ